MRRFLRFFIVILITIEARLILRKYKPRIVAITGSVGKTSTKDALFTVLRPTFFVRKSEKSFNSDIGIPLTILGAPNGWSNPLAWTRIILDGLKLILYPTHYPKLLVLEVGADRPGDIKKIVRFVKPNVVVITHLPDVPAHVEFFDSPESVIAEKGELVRALRPGGILVVNYDDARARALKAPEGVETITFGFTPDALIRGEDDVILYDGKQPVGMRMRASYKNERVEISVMRALGRQHLYPVLAALAVALSEGVSLENAARTLTLHETPPGRMKIIKGKNNTTLIDDSYNSSPIAAEEALEVMAKLDILGRKIAVLGDMLELGSFSPEEHRRIGELAAKKVHMLFAVGLRSRTMAESARRAGLPKDSVRHFTDALVAGEALAAELHLGDVVLVKGSQSMRMERVVERAMAEPEHKKELLPRQEKEWQNR